MVPFSKPCRDDQEGRHVDVVDAGRSVQRDGIGELDPQRPPARYPGGDSGDRAQLRSLRQLGEIVRCRGATGTLHKSLPVLDDLGASIDALDLSRAPALCRKPTPCDLLAEAWPLPADLFGASLDPGGVVLALSDPCRKAERMDVTMRLWLPGCFRRRWWTARCESADPRLTSGARVLAVEVLGWVGSALLVYSVLQTRIVCLRLFNGVASALLVIMAPASIRGSC
jgi:hypothetical protein